MKISLGSEPDKHCEAHNCVLSWDCWSFSGVRLRSDEPSYVKIMSRKRSQLKIIESLRHYKF